MGEKMNFKRARKLKYLIEVFLEFSYEYPLHYYGGVTPTPLGFFLVNISHDFSREGGTCTRYWFERL